MKIEEMWFPHDGRTVHGMAYWPEVQGKVPMVILSHGYGGTEIGAVPQATYLAERGIAAVCLTLCGGSNGDRSGFPTTRMSIITERNDILAALSKLRRDPRVDADRVALFGESQGGMASVLASVQAAEQVAALALLYPALCIPDDWRARFKTEEEMPETLEFWGMLLGRVYYRDASSIHIFEVLPQYQGPVLLLHGEQDQVVNVSYARKAASLYKDCELHIYPTEKHGFTKDGVQSVCERLYAFAHRTLCEA